LTAKGTPFSDDDLHKLAFHADQRTVFLLYELLRGKSVDETIRATKERWLSPGLAEVMQIIKEERFTSSTEVMAMSKQSTSNASNKLAALERDGVIVKVFAFLAKGGGKRHYYAHAEDDVSDGEIKAFCEKLGDGYYRVAGKAHAA
jgi:hypothetical protein